MHSVITLADGDRIVTIFFVLVWGAGFGAVPVAAPTWMAQTMPETVEGGLALFVSALQGSLAAVQRSAGSLYYAYGPVGALVTATISAGLGSAVSSGRTGAAVDRGPDDSRPPSTAARDGGPASP